MTRKISWSLFKEPEADELAAEVSEHEGYEQISVRGRLTLDSSPTLLEELRKVFDEHPGLGRLKVDLSDVAFIDSSGISVLIQGLKLAQDRGADYVLLDPSPKVRSVIELSQLHEFFTVEITPGPS